MTTLPDVSTGPAWDPSRPAARIYVQGHTYKLVSAASVPTFLANTVKLILNWVTAGGNVAKNITYALFPTGVDTTVPTFLKSVANQLMTSLAATSPFTNVAPTWQLQSVTCKDNSGLSSGQATSDHAGIPGTGSGLSLPPNCAIVISWKISAAYRGGKPRWYIPGAVSSVLTASYGSAIQPSVAGALATAAEAFRLNFNSSTIATFNPVLGTVSRYASHAPRPVPLFRAFQGVEVHERLDSQRRRSGKESAFGELP